MERSENIVNTLSELITKEMEQAFTAAGYDAKFAKVTVSNRPDLCEYISATEQWQLLRHIRKHQL